MKIKYRFLKIFVLILLLGFLMNFAIKRHNNREVTQINININNSDKVNFITESMVKETLNKTAKNKIEAKKIEDIDIIKTEKSLNSNQAISISNVFIDLKGKINISINQRIPVVRVKTNKEEFYLDETGTKFSLSQIFAYPCLIANGDINSSEYESLVELCQLINTDSMLKNHIIAIKKDTKSNYNLLLNVDGVYIEYGLLNNNLQKLTSLKEFYKQYLDYIGFNSYKKISLKYKNQIVATKR